MGLIDSYYRRNRRAKCNQILFQSPSMGLIDSYMVPWLVRYAWHAREFQSPSMGLIDSYEGVVGFTPISGDAFQSPSMGLIDSYITSLATLRMDEQVSIPFNGAY